MSCISEQRSASKPKGWILQGSCFVAPHRLLVEVGVVPFHRPSDVLPITRAPGVGCESPDTCANLSLGDTAELEDSPVEKGLSSMPPSQDGEAFMPGADAPLLIHTNVGWTSTQKSS